MNQTAHTSSAFERDLVELNGALMRLGMLASKQLNGSLRAMSDFQENRIEMLIDRDRELDELEAEINERVLMIITVRSPRADDLRRVLAATKAAQSLERIGDYARNVGKRTRSIMESEPGQLPCELRLSAVLLDVRALSDELYRKAVLCSNVASREQAASRGCVLRLF